VFGGEVASLLEWPFGAEDLGRLRVPTLSLVSSGTYWAGFRETHEVLLSRIPGCEGADLPIPRTCCKSPIRGRWRD
jgi:hypothetical protein